MRQNAGLTLFTLHANASNFGSRSKNATFLCDVELYGHEWLKTSIDKLKPKLSEFLAQNSLREKV